MSKTAQFVVADDDRSVRTFLVHALTRQGYKVSAVTTLASLQIVLQAVLLWLLELKAVQIS